MRNYFLKSFMWCVFLCAKLCDGQQSCVGELCSLVFKYVSEFDESILRAKTRYLTNFCPNFFFLWWFLSIRLLVSVKYLNHDIHNVCITHWTFFFFSFLVRFCIAKIILLVSTNYLHHIE